MKIFFAFITFLFLSPFVASAANDSTVVNLEVAFCDGDLICDPEENYISCLSDCPAPTATSTPPTEDDDEPSRASSRFSGFITLIKNFIPFFPRTSTTTDICRTGVCTVISLDSDGNYVTSISPTTLLPQTVVSVWPAQEEKSIVFVWDRGITIRILKSKDGFPQDPFTGGVLAYAGSKGFFEDKSDQKQISLFYSIFTKDSSGRYGDPQLILVKKSALATPTVPDESPLFLWVAVGALALFVIRKFWRFLV